MYETRQHAALQHDENQKDEPKAALTKAQFLPANNRKTLGDIGNLVVASSAANTTKDGQTEFQNAAKKAGLPVVDRPFTRSLGPWLSHNHDMKEDIAADKEIVEGMKHMKLSGKQELSRLESNNLDSGKVPDSKDVPPGHPARKKELLNGRGGRAGAGKQHKRRTLTAALTAASEAACGGFKPDVIEEPVTDIDAGDIGNQLAVVDYIEDIYSFYRKTETQSCVPPDYMSQQLQINEKMRAVLVDWLIEVHYKFKLMPETLFLTTNVLDRYLAIQHVERKNLQLVGMTAMLVSSKYEEIWAPEIQDLISISENAYTRQQILDMEKVMLNSLKFNFCVPTPYMFLVRFLKAAHTDQQMSLLAFYFVELCMVEYAMLRFAPSMLAASAVYLARNTLRTNEEAHWNSTLRQHSGYTDLQLIECANVMVVLHKKAGEGNLTVVRRKYSLSKFGSVAFLQTGEDASSMVALHKKAGEG